MDQFLKTNWQLLFNLIDFKTLANYCFFFQKLQFDQMKSCRYPEDFSFCLPLVLVSINSEEHQILLLEDALAT
jgi:hypothetical protein